MRIGNNYLAMEEFYGSFQVCNGHKHVLCSRNIFCLEAFTLMFYFVYLDQPGSYIFLS